MRQAPRRHNETTPETRFPIEHMSTPTRRWPLIIGGTFLALLVAGFISFQLGIRALKSQVEQVLGQYGEVKEIRVAPTGVEVIGIRLRTPQTNAHPRSGGKDDWPADDQLRAERILIVPSWRDLLSAKVVLQSIRVEGAYLSMLRARDGRIRVLPSLLEKPATDGSPVPPITVGKIELKDSVVEFFDATVRQPPHKLRLEQIDASVESLHLPELKGQSQLKIEGVLKGPRHDGKIVVSGTIELASKESEITTRLRGVDLIALQPYLIKAAETGVHKGTLDLDLKSTVRQGQLHAPGSMTLSGLELAPTGGNTFMGMPRAAVVAMMKDQSGQITIKFALDGNINDPRFSLNENLMARVGSSLASGLGISLEGLARGVGSTGSGLAKGIGASLGKLFGK
jgi:hypothetical protein